MLKFNATAPVGAGLGTDPQGSLAEWYHEASKLTLTSASALQSESQFSAFELYMVSRAFKQFKNAPRISLGDIEHSGEPLQDILRRRRSRRDLTGALSLADLSTVLQQALGPSAVFQNTDYQISQALRAYPSAGGLYPLDTYVVASGVHDVNPGIYHYNLITNELEGLQSRPVGEVLRDGFFWQDFITRAAAVLLFVAVFTRTGAKYGERGYRLVLLDAGHACQNVLLTAEQLHLSAVPVGGFCDASLAEDLNIDGVSEAVVHSVVLGKP